MSPDSPVIPTLDVGNHRLPCSICDKGRTDTALSVTVDADRVVWICFRCGSKGARGRDGTIRRVVASQRPVQAARGAGSNRELAASIWNSAVPLKGTLGEQYLLLRRCALSPAAGDLRFHPAVRYSAEDRELPALVAKVTTVIGNTFIGVHRVWIAPNSPKAIAKRRLGGSDEPVCVRLWPDADVESGLALAEGIESALAVAHYHRPVWATICAGGMEKFPVLPGLGELTIFADHDPVGLDAAAELRRRYRTAGTRCRALHPRREGADVNDLLMGSAA